MINVKSIVLVNYISLRQYKFTENVFKRLVFKAISLRKVALSDKFQQEIKMS
jgi:hypothetical protein